MPDPFRRFMTPALLNVFDLVVRDWLARRPISIPFFFVQIGAHDGLHLDPIRKYVLKHSWTGLLIEPQPAIFERLKMNYAGQPGLWFLQAAIAEIDGTVPLYRFKEGQALPDHASMLASFYRDALANNAHGYRGEIEELPVPAVTVATLRRTFPLEVIDLLQVDAEGEDARIIRHFLEPSPGAHLPAIIHFESAWKSPLYYRLLPELAQHGYRVCEVGNNSVCYLGQRDDAFDSECRNAGY